MKYQKPDLSVIMVVCDKTISNGLAVWLESNSGDPDAKSNITTFLINS